MFVGNLLATTPDMGWIIQEKSFHNSGQNPES
jgi:hypothetical protein